MLRLRNDRLKHGDRPKNDSMDIIDIIDTGYDDLSAQPVKDKHDPRYGVSWIMFVNARLETG